MDDELYQVPLAEFTRTRDRIAAQLKAAGNTDTAAELKRARKPSLPAWAANQVVWQAPEAWQRLRAAGRALRLSHQKAASADAVREATREQREALSACEARASQMLVQHGHAVTPALLEKVGHTLLALAYGASGLTPGRLETDLPPPGFEALAGLALAPAPRQHEAEPPPPEPKQETDGEQKLQAAERRHAEEEARARQRAERSAAEARQAESRRALVKARALLETEEQRARTLEGQLEAARRACQEARRQLEAAEAEDRAAAAALDPLPQQPQAS